MEQNKRKLGGSYEAKAAAFLQAEGLRILKRNFRCKQGEVDLIARDGDYLVFVEVKYRGPETAGTSLEAVDIRKQRRLSRAAEYFLLTNAHSFDIPCRFDVVGFDGDMVRWVKNAFDFIA